MNAWEIALAIAGGIALGVGAFAVIVHYGSEMR